MSNRPTTDLPSPVSSRSPFWLGASLLFVLLRSFQCICYPIARDQATYCYVGQGLWHGKQLYLNFWDNKPPGIFYLYAVIVKVFGNAMWSVGLVDILWLLVISILIFKFAERYLGTAPAVIAVIVHATWRAAAGYWDAGQPENFLMLFVLSAYLLSTHRAKRQWPFDFLSGICFGAAFWLKYNAIAFVPLLMLLPFLDFSPLAAGARLSRFNVSRREYFRRVGVWAGAFTLCGVLVLGYLAWVGAWPAMKQIQFEVLPRYNAMAFERSRNYGLFVLQQIGVYLGWWTVLVAAVALLAARRIRDLSATLPVFLAAGMGLLCTLMQGRLPSFAFETCYPFFAMLWGYLAVRVFQAFRYFSRLCWRRQLRLAAVLVWVVFANLLYLPLPNEVVQFKLYVDDLRAWRRDSTTFYSNYPWARPISHFDGQMQVIRYLREHSSPQDGVFVWGSEPLIYYLAQRNPPTRFISNLALISLWAPPAWRQEMLRALDAHRPKYIVIAREDWVPMISFNFLDSAGYLQQRFPEFRDFMQQHYQTVADYGSFVICQYE